ncbi:MAG: hypothetical protein IJH34_04880 [Romboutsia sp.]|nr:hypothetical protein [Romboutsia sp.]
MSDYADKNYYIVTEEELTDVADAIRDQLESSEGLTFPNGFITGIGNISSGGGSDINLIVIQGTTSDGSTFTNKSINKTYQEINDLLKNKTPLLIKFVLDYAGQILVSNDGQIIGTPDSNGVFSIQSSIVYYTNGTNVITQVILALDLYNNDSLVLNLYSKNIQVS